MAVVVKAAVVGGSFSSSITGSCFVSVSGMFFSLSTVGKGSIISLTVGSLDESSFAALLADDDFTLTLSFSTLSSLSSP